jgi:hypothetical protein
MPEGEEGKQKGVKRVSENLARVPDYFFEIIDG